MPSTWAPTGWRRLWARDKQVGAGAGVGLQWAALTTKAASTPPHNRSTSRSLAPAAAAGADHLSDE